MHVTAGEVRTNSNVTFSFRPLYMDEQAYRTTSSYLKQLCTDTRCSLEDLLKVTDGS